jgi:hypothetical protein
MMKPILFNMEMVKAILDGRKTATRRVIKPQPRRENSYYGGCVTHSVGDKWKGYVAFTRSALAVCDFDFAKPKYQVGDILWVRETWQCACDMDANEDFIDGTERYLYAASDVPKYSAWINQDGSTSDHMPWRPSIHMPKEAARLFLKVIDVKVEILQDIQNKSFDEIMSEGINPDNLYSSDSETGYPSAIHLFIQLWNSTINKADIDKYGWNANPWVWVYEFEICEKPDEFGVIK